MLVGEFSEERMYPREIAWMERKSEVTTRVVGGRRMIPSRRAFKYLAWLSRSIPVLAVAVGWEAGGSEPQSLAQQNCDQADSEATAD